MSQPWLRSVLEMPQLDHGPTILSWKNLLRLVLLGLFALAYLGPTAVLARAFEISYSVWHRDAALSPEEESELAAQGTTRLLWHVGTLRGSNGEWVTTGPLVLLPKGSKSPSVVAVFLIAPEHDLALSAPAAAALAKRLLPWLRNQHCAEVQIDFDCPDRRLSEYAAFLRELGAKLHPLRLSVTALAGWSRLPAFRELEDAVDALYPMFYDLRPDTPDAVRRGEILPLLDYNSIKDDLARWAKCRKPWFAGLPNFARVTLFHVTARVVVISAHGIGTTSAFLQSSVLRTLHTPD